MRSGFLMLALIAARQVVAQPRAVPMDPASIETGRVLYLKWCAACHGPNARGGEGPNLYRSRVLLASPPRAAHELITKGIPGSEMRPFRLKEDETYPLIGYLYSLTRPGIGPPAAGDVEAGKALFASRGCDRCHMIGGRGGVLGPDLSGIALRSLAEQIRRSITDPDAEIAEGFSTVTVTLRTGERLTGALRNEDNFSLQVMKPDGEYLLALRAQVASSEELKRSLMPAEKLTEGELRNLVAYLHRQRQLVLKYVSNFQTY